MYQAKKNDLKKVAACSKIWNRVGSCARHYLKEEMMMNSEKAVINN